MKKLNCAVPEETKIQGTFTNMVWVKFSSTAFRDDALKKCARPSFKYKDTKIWADKDLPYDKRQLISCLLGMRKNFITRGLDTGGIYVDKDALQLSYYGDMVVTLSNENNRMMFQFGDGWSEYCCEGNFEELHQTCENRLSKGHGKGKSKTKSKQPEK